jgi:HPt (histidine-containing phosphotransfer) domain-containing protein
MSRAAISGRKRPSPQAEEEDKATEAPQPVVTYIDINDAELVRKVGIQLSNVIQEKKQCMEEEKNLMKQHKDVKKILGMKKKLDKTERELKKSMKDQMAKCNIEYVKSPDNFPHAFHRSKQMKAPALTVEFLLQACQAYEEELKSSNQVFCAGSFVEFVKAYRDEHKVATWRFYARIPKPKKKKKSNDDDDDDDDEDGDGQTDGENDDDDEFEDDGNDEVMKVAVL